MSTCDFRFIVASIVPGVTSRRGGSKPGGDTQLIIAESLGYGEYSKQLKATLMSLTMGIRAYGKSLA